VNFNKDKLPAEIDYLESHFPWLKEGPVGQLVQELEQTLEGMDATEICGMLKFCSQEEPDYSPAISDEMIDYINSSQTMWKSGRNIKFDSATKEDVKQWLGTVVDPDV